MVKTQGSDTKLVGQLQPYDEAKGLSRMQLAGRSVPPLVTQIADGENGGAEYLEQLFATGIQPADLPVAQPLFQHRIWGDGPRRWP